MKNKMVFPLHFQALLFFEKLVVVVPFPAESKVPLRRYQLQLILMIQKYHHLPPEKNTNWSLHFMEFMIFEIIPLRKVRHYHHLLQWFYFVRLKLFEYEFVVILYLQ